MVKTYKKKHTRRQRRNYRQRTRVRHVIRRKIQRGGTQLDDKINEIVKGIEISVVKNAFRELGFIQGNENPNVSLTVERIYEISNSVKKLQNTVSFNFGNEIIDFTTVLPDFKSLQQSIYIYTRKNIDDISNNKIYGRIMIVINNNSYHGSYYELAATAIFNSVAKYIQNKPQPK